MRHLILTCGALALTLPVPVAAQTINDDVRCLLLSASFARVAKDENTRRGAAMTGAFYLGRVDGRISKPALAAAIRAQGKGLPAKEAAAAMQACAARATAAEQQVSAAQK